MSRYLLVHGDSAAGNLKASKTTVRGVDVIRGLSDLDLATGPIPATLDLDVFSHERNRLSRNPEEELAGDRTFKTHEECLVEAATFDQVELWFGPRPGSQLALAQMITIIAHRPDLLAKSVLIPLDYDLGETSHEVTAARRFERIQLSARLIVAGVSTWAAWSSPDPRLWLALLDEPPQLPHLAPVIHRLLAELPHHATGLTLTQTQLLRIAATGSVSFVDLMTQWHALPDDRAMTYWPLGQALLDMMHGPAPLLSGLREENFNLVLHEKGRRERFYAGQISLTPHGEQVLAGAVDYTSIAPIDYHWGGTQITNDNLWRWNAETKSLIAP